MSKTFKNEIADDFGHKLTVCPFGKGYCLMIQDTKQKVVLFDLSKRKNIEELINSLSNYLLKD